MTFCNVLLPGLTENLLFLRILVIESIYAYELRWTLYVYFTWSLLFLPHAPESGCLSMWHLKSDIKFE